MHIQSSEGVEYTVDYWGYAVRNMPCTNDAGSCAYLDSVYGDHYTSMVYTFIMWAVFGVILLLTTFSRLVRPSKKGGDGAQQSVQYRLVRCVASTVRQYLVPECSKVFRYTTRLQVLVLAVLCAYLTAFSFAGITYKVWVTPVKGTNLHNIRSGIGGFADRLGAFAFALTPLTIALCARDSVLSLLTGIPYQNFNFLHRWTGRIILVQSFIHAILWTIVEGRLYQPQPTVYVEWIKQKYMIWGIVAQFFITFLFVFSLRPVIRWTGYEFFRKSHLLVAGLYMGACWGHWDKLSCWMIASLAIMGFDLVARTVRTCLIHCGYKDSSSGFGFRSIPAKMETFNDPTGTIIRMTFTHIHQPWDLGQHFYLTFPALNIWQSHPFTPLTNSTTTSPVQSHTYLIRARDGETKNLAAAAAAAANCYPPTDPSTPVILQGPYGGTVTSDETTNLLAISAGTGISYTLPIVRAALSPSSPVRVVELIWTIRHIENLLWIAEELKQLKSYLDAGRTRQRYDGEKTPIVSAEATKQFRIRIFVTRPASSLHVDADADGDNKEYGSEGKEFGSGYGPSLTPSSSFSSTNEHHTLSRLLMPHSHFSTAHIATRPRFTDLIDAFMDDTAVQGRTKVIGSGTAALGTQIRSAVAGWNRPGSVWRGEGRGDVECVWDDRVG